MTCVANLFRGGIQLQGNLFTAHAGELNQFISGMLPFEQHDVAFSDIHGFAEKAD